MVAPNLSPAHPACSACSLGIHVLTSMICWSCVVRGVVENRDLISVLNHVVR